MDKKIFHINGVGCNPDGTGSGFAWVRLDRDRQYVEWADGLTNHQAEYRALMSVFRYLAPGGSALIHTDSRLVCNQFSNREVRDSRLHDLVFEGRCLMNAKNLEVTVLWIPRKENLARKLLDRERRALGKWPNGRSKSGPGIEYDVHHPSEGHQPRFGESEED